ncbi:hypothetical protein M885DRAFT_537500 [Pelagophyceae sp. CCMP2097]|nr:hypothetical protein M885DRAFT_537500 [Pelagophyceae sp. CCMP2097]
MELPPGMLRAEAQPGLEANKLEVFLIRARGLLAPNAVVTFAVRGGMETRASTAADAADADWGEAFALPADGGFLDVSVSRAGAPDAALGRFHVALEALADRGASRRWYKLRVGLDDVDVGEVELGLRWTHDEDYTVELPRALLKPEAQEDAPPNCLHVFLVRGRNLGSVRGDASDAIVTFDLDAPGEADAPSGWTQTSSRTKEARTPAWMEGFVFAVDSRDANLCFRCDARGADGADVILGHGSFGLDALRGREVHRRWFALGGAGILDVAMRWVYDAAFPLALPEDWAEKEARSAHNEVPNVLQCFVLRARRLPPREDGTAVDPFVSLTLGARVCRTSTKRTQASPCWMERFSLATSTVKDVARLTLSDAASAYVLGGFDVDVSTLRDQRVHRSWRPLRAPDGGKAPEVEIALRWVFDPQQKAPREAKRKPLVPSLIRDGALGGLPANACKTRVVSLHAQPAVAMLWNDALAGPFRVDQARRWWISGAPSTGEAWTRRELSGFCKLCCIHYFGPDNVKDLAVAVDWHAYLQTLRALAHRHEVLLHDHSLDFAIWRARRNGWWTPAVERAICQRHEKALDALLGAQMPTPEPKLE